MSSAKKSGTKTPSPARRALSSQEQRLANVVEQNIGTLLEVRQEFERRKGIQDRVADAITSFSGSMRFVYLHALWFGVWIVLNLGILGIKPFDPFPFGLLTMIVSLEAIFLSTFILVSQNRMSLVSDRRADLDVQINLLAEHEITRLLTLVHAIAKHLDVECIDSDMEELEQDVAPADVLKEMEQREQAEQATPTA